MCRDYPGRTSRCYTEVIKRTIVLFHFHAKPGTCGGWGLLFYELNLQKSYFLP